LPDAELDAELCYWLGVANMADDAAAERWFSRAWSGFVEQGDLRGQQLTAAQAVLSKTDSWRTHEGLSTWTRRVLELLDRGPFGVDGAEQLLISAGTVRALDFADHYSSDSPAAKRLTLQLLERLGSPRAEDPPTLRLLASESLIEHASATGNAELFEKAVDNVAAHLRDRDTSPWALGMWLVAFGAATGRHFSYARRGFPYPSPEAALRAAIAIGEREALRGVEFGALYHLQYSMKLRNDFAEFEALIDRLAEIADSRYTTQVAVVADCRAALHTVQENFGAAYRDCERFMAAIEAANEPPIERWPHFVTKFQVLLADRKPREAAALLEPLLSLFAGGVRRRTQACVSVASALDAKWNDAKLYSGILRDCMSDIRAASWNAILLNLPELLAELCGDAIELDIEPELCRSLIDRRRLTPPRDPRTARWPWPLKVHVLGDFKLERDGAPLDLGTRPPTRSLDIVRALAIAKDHTCSLEDLYEWLWPEADGAQAKSACEQALHRLRKLLGSADLIVQREGKLRLAPDGVWVDLADWEARIRRAFAPAAEPSIADSLLERAFHDFRGPLLRSERTAAWAMPAIERVHGRFIDLVVRLGKRLEARHELSAARTVYLRALDHYPTSERCYEALLRLRLAEDDRGAALEDYRRYERILASTLAAKPSRTIRALIAPLLAGASAAE
jgi:LuxR family maltose regulon positive regulatory protein